MSAETPARRRPSGLGRGLSALLGEVEREQPIEAGEARAEGVRMIAISSVSVSLNSRTSAGTSCSRARCAARQRRSPATIW